jgi:phosphoserine phosphatase RsbX
MNDAVRTGHAVIVWGWSGSALELESGDLHVVIPFPGGALVGLIDGLGHGPEAAAAASAAAGLLEAHASDSVLVLVQRCHDALRKTRGAAMSLASFRTEDSSMTWLGIGNVDGVLVLGNGALAAGIAARGGVVGYQIPMLRTSTVRVSPGDTLIMATDGIRGRFTADLAIDHEPQEIAESTLARFARGSDDAHVLVARYLGGQR